MKLWKVNPSEWKKKPLDVSHCLLMQMHFPTMTAPDFQNGPKLFVDQWQNNHCSNSKGHWSTFKCLKKMLRITTHTCLHTHTPTPSMFEVDTVWYCPDCIIKNRLQTDVHQVTVARAAKVHEQAWVSPRSKFKLFAEIQMQKAVRGSLWRVSAGRAQMETKKISLQLCCTYTFQAVTITESVKHYWWHSKQEYKTTQKYLSNKANVCVNPVIVNITGSLWPNQLNGDIHHICIDSKTAPEMMNDSVINEGQQLEETTSFNV